MTKISPVRRRAVLSWCGVAFAVAMVGLAVMTIAAFRFNLSIDPNPVMGLIVALTLIGTWLWRWRDARRPTTKTALLTFVGQCLALVLGYVVFWWTFGHIYPPNVT